VAGEPLISGGPLHKEAYPSDNELRTRRGSHGVPAEHGLLKHQRTLSPTPRFCGRFGGARRSSNPEPHWSDLGTFTRFSATGPIETVVHQLRLILSPQPISTLVPAPLSVVRRRSDGAQMGVFAATSRLLAEEIARRWHGSVELLPIGDHQHPRGHSGDTKGKPRWVS
jgi:hypothetical protein